MEIDAKTYRASCRATFLGAAIGDAISFPYKDYSRTFLLSLARPISEEFGAVPGARFASGQYTHDTQVALAVARAFTEAEGVDARIVVEHMIPLWRDLLVIDAEPSCTEAMQRVVRGLRDWKDCGHETGRAESGALCRAIPLGLWAVGGGARLESGAAAVTTFTHRDARVVACVAGAAAAIEFNLEHRDIVLGDFLDAISTAAEPHDAAMADAIQDMPRILTQTDLGAWDLIDETLPDPAYPPRRDGVNSYCVSTLLLALYYFLKSPLDFEKTLRRVSRLGGDMGTVVTLTTSLSASRNGLGEISKGLLTTLQGRDELEEIVDDFVEARLRVDHANDESIGSLPRTAASTPRDRDER